MVLIVSFPVHKDLRETLVILGLLDLKVTPVIPVLMEQILLCRDLLVLRVTQAILVLRVLKVFREFRDLKVIPEHKGLRVLLVLKAIKVIPVLRVIMVRASTLRDMLLMRQHYRQEPLRATLM
jgi:hypothetical protein